MSYFCIKLDVKTQLICCFLHISFIAKNTDEMNKFQDLLFLDNHIILIFS